MKVLWITNIPLPDTCRAMGWDAPVTGGWMSALAGFLTGARPDLELAVASTGPVGGLVEKRSAESAVSFFRRQNAPDAGKRFNRVSRPKSFTFTEPNTRTGWSGSANAETLMPLSPFRDLLRFAPATVSEESSAAS